MAKRTPQSDAGDTPNTTNTASTPRQPRPRAESSEGRDRARTSRDAGTASTTAEAPEDQGQSDAMGLQPSEDEIRYRAYLLYIERGGGHGMDFEDWLQAEKELKARR